MHRSGHVTAARFEALKSVARAAGFAMAHSDDPAPPPPRLLIEYQPPQDLATLAWRSPRLKLDKELDGRRSDWSTWRGWLASFDWRATA